ncbi:hypothetical protein GGR55DRAFT_669899 [Xylaria sp. FL0064]|nr:hypothetical protein GGR55DRAFT_669899 [Xylaria sp. FL0064]
MISPFSAFTALASNQTLTARLSALPEEFHVVLCTKGVICLLRVSREVVMYVRTLVREPSRRLVYCLPWTGSVTLDDPTQEICFLTNHGSSLSCSRFHCLFVLRQLASEKKSWACSDILFVPLGLSWLLLSSPRSAPFLSSLPLSLHRFPRHRKLVYLCIATTRNTPTPGILIAVSTCLSLPLASCLIDNEPNSRITLNMSDISDSQISALDLPSPAFCIHFTTDNDNMDTIVVDKNSEGGDNDTFTPPRAFSEILQSESPGEQIARLRTELKSLEQEKGHMSQRLVEYKISSDEKDESIQRLLMKIEQGKSEKDSLNEQVANLQVQLSRAKTDLESSDSQLRSVWGDLREARAETSRAKEAEKAAQGQSDLVTRNLNKSIQKMSQLQQALPHMQAQYSTLQSIHDENVVATCRDIDWFMNAKRNSDSNLARTRKVREDLKVKRNRDIQRMKAVVSERELELKRAREQITRLANIEVGLQVRSPRKCLCFPSLVTQPLLSPIWYYRVLFGQFPFADQLFIQGRIHELEERI